MPSAFSASTAAGNAGFRSTLITRGTGLPGALRAARKKRVAAAASRLAVTGSEQKVDGLTGRIDGAIQVPVLALHRYICLVRAVALIGGLQVYPAALIEDVLQPQLGRSDRL